MIGNEKDEHPNPTGGPVTMFDVNAGETIAARVAE
jgi:hypothetical protein